MRNGRAKGSGVRSGYWSENKFTNLTQYSPYYSQIEKLLKEHASRLERDDDLFYYSYPAVSGFVQPLTIADVKKYISHLPTSFTKDLRGIFLCPGAKKQLNFSSIFYGCYSTIDKCIFLFPFPQEMCLHYRTKPKPSLCQEFERHGATWIQERNCWTIHFTVESLRSFYLRDVLIHEVGHHVDNISSLTSERCNDMERFAEWFAIEFGMKTKGNQLTEFGEMLQDLITLGQ